LKEVFEDRAFYYIVMEMCVGGELMDRIVDHQHFTEKVASSYFRQMLLGVQHCHTHMVVHRCVGLLGVRPRVGVDAGLFECGSDLKPENFLFDAPGPSAVLKLTDFGLSCGIHAQDEIITEVRLVWE
jgi:serine/threonine protein kinase